jgi:Opioid growth factor receptor (OGFr) conserved region
MSRLVAFYRGEATDTEGRRLEAIWGWDDEYLEIAHDYVQWLFPLTEPSQFNRDAPVLTDAGIAAFHTDSVLRSKLRKSFERMLTFFGLAIAEDGRAVDGPNFAARVPDVWAEPNHNWLRVTRILRSLTLLGLAPLAQALFSWLEATYGSRKFPISDETFWYWTEAVNVDRETAGLQ